MAGFTDNLLTIHVVLSLLEIPAGLALVSALLKGRAPGGFAFVFLILSALTCLTGFPLPPPGLDPARIVGILALALTAAAAFAFYVRRARGAWGPIFVVGAVAALYLDVFVAIVQSFQKLSFLQPLAPTQSEPPFLIAQTVALAIFVALGALAVSRFRRNAAQAR